MYTSGHPVDQSGGFSGNDADRSSRSPFYVQNRISTRERRIEEGVYQKMEGAGDFQKFLKVWRASEVTSAVRVSLANFQKFPRV